MKKKKQKNAWKLYLVTGIMAFVMAIVSFSGCGNTNSSQNVIITDSMRAAASKKMDFDPTWSEKGGMLEKYEGDVENVIIPSEINGYKVVAIGPEAFKNVKCETIEIPGTVEEIDTHAFLGCTAKSIELRDGLLRVETGAFQECPNLESITFPEGTTTIETMAIYKCPKLKEVYVPETVVPSGDKDALAGIPIECENAVVITPKDSSVYKIAKEQGVQVKESSESNSSKT